MWFVLVAVCCVLLVLFALRLLLRISCWLVFDVWCVMSIAGCLLRVGTWLLCAVYCLLVIMLVRAVC